MISRSWTEIEASTLTQGSLPDRERWASEARLAGAPWSSWPLAFAGESSSLDSRFLFLSLAATGQAAIIESRQARPIIFAVFIMSFCGHFRPAGQVIC